MSRHYRIRPQGSPIPTDAEFSLYRDFGRLVYNYQHMTRPLYKRPLYRDPRALFVILIIVLLAILIAEASRKHDLPERPTQPEMGRGAEP